MGGRLTAAVLLLALAPMPARADEPTFRLRVVDERGRPVAGATVDVGLAADEVVTKRLTSDRRGRVEVPVPRPGVVVAIARAADGRVGATESIGTEGCLEEGCTVEGIDSILDVRVEQLARVTGHVLGPDGRPVAGARVGIRWIGSGQGSSLGTLYDDERFIPAVTDRPFVIDRRLRRHRLLDELQQLHATIGRHPSTTTDAAGAYLLEPPRAGAYAILVDAEGAASIATGAVQLLPGVTSTLDVRLAPGFRLSGRVVPTRPGVVELTDGCDSVWRGIAADGSFAFDALPSGRYHVRANSQAGPSPVVEVSSQTAAVRITLGPGPARPPAPLPGCPGPPPDADYDDYPEDFDSCELGTELYGIEGRQVVVRIWARDTGPPLREGDVVERIDGAPAPRGRYGRCGARVRLEVLRPATGERFTARALRARQVDNGS